MLMLLAMIATGVIAYRKKWVSDEGYTSMTSVIVHLFNPCMIIYAVMSKGPSSDHTALLQTFIMSLIYFAFLIVISIPVAKLLKVSRKEESTYRMMMIFSNTGNMGYPVVIGLFGAEALLLVVPYNIVFNILVYTYGVALMQKYNPDKKQIDRREQLKKIFLNEGMICGVTAILLYFWNPEYPEAVVSFFDYMGNAVIPVAMFLTGVSLAREFKKEFFTDSKIYWMSFIKLLVIPIAVALLFKAVNVPLLPVVKGINLIMLAVPAGNMVLLMATEYGGDEPTATKGVVITTVLSVLTMTLVALFF